ncbi:ABC transporter ATP-binding protein [Marinovum sp.]|uniref:ABC transporter ATP-binding protein n=1 Tax=Marinovum sp. TaxID=2024839 RepID=UPI003A957CDE
MSKFKTLNMAWALLDSRERRNFGILLGIVIVSALSSAVMVGSILPFLSVLSDPGRIHSVPALSWAYEILGFDSDYTFLVGLGLASLAVIVFANGISIVKTWAIARFTSLRVHSISHRLLTAYLRQPYAFFLNRHSAEMGTRILSETQQVVRTSITPAVELIAALFTVIAIVTLLLLVEPVVAVIAFAVLGGIYGGIFALSRRALKQLGRQRAETNGARFQITNEALGGIKDIKLLGCEDAYLARYARYSLRMARTLARIALITQLPQYGLQVIAFGGIILLCLVLVDADGLASGTALNGILPVLGLFAFAGQRLMPELSKLYQSLTKLQAGAAAVEIVHDDLAAWTDREEKPADQARLSLQDRLVLENVSYSYPDAAHAGVRNVSLTINAGEKIGIVGGTGAGKTTLADLVLGLLTPTMGRLVVDGTAVTKETLRAWQKNVGYVPQNIFLTDASIAENIALGVPRKKIDEARVVEAARIAQLDGFIRSELPEGYATSVGERGVRLSGGQRQRIGIARALYHDADFIVFDEATSALDNLTEREVMAAIDALPEEKTVLMIAHRLSTVQGCDRIVVMDQGKVVGYDSWSALMVGNPLFQRIARSHETA